MWQLGTLVGAPVGIGLVAGIAVPAMIIGEINFYLFKYQNRVLQACIFWTDPESVNLQLYLETSVCVCSLRAFVKPHNINMWISHKKWVCAKPYNLTLPNYRDVIFSLIVHN